MTNTLTIDPASDTFTSVREVDPADPFSLAEAKVEVAKAALRKRAQELEDAAETLPQVRARLLGGDDSVSASELAAAHAAQERAELLHRAAESALKRALKAGPFRPDVAALLVEAIAKWADIEPEAVAIVDEAGAVGAIDSVTLRQTSRTERKADMAGALSCEELEATFWRSQKMVAAEWARLERAFEKAGHNVSVHSRACVEKDGKVGDMAVLVARAVWPRDIILSGALDVSAWDAGHFVSAIVGKANEQVSSHITLSTEGMVKGRSTSGNKITTTVESTLVAKGGRERSTGQALPAGGTGAILASAAEAMVGKPFAGLGRCMSVEAVEGSGGYDDFSTFRHRIRATFVAIAA